MELQKRDRDWTQKPIPLTHSTHTYLYLFLSLCRRNTLFWLERCILDFIWEEIISVTFDNVHVGLCQLSLMTQTSCSSLLPKIHFLLSPLTLPHHVSFRAVLRMVHHPNNIWSVKVLWCSVFNNRQSKGGGWGGWQIIHNNWSATATNCVQISDNF